MQAFALPRNPCLIDLSRAFQTLETGILVAAVTKGFVPGCAAAAQGGITTLPGCAAAAAMDGEVALDEQRTVRQWLDAEFTAFFAQSGA